MLKVQLSIPDLKAQVLALREMAQDPMALLQSLTAELRPRFAEWMNELLVSELSLHLGRSPTSGRRDRATTATDLGAGG